jgi:hypothetical protein
VRHPEYVGASCVETAISVSETEADMPDPDKIARLPRQAFRPRSAAMPVRLR